MNFGSFYVRNLFLVTKRKKKKNKKKTNIINKSLGSAKQQYQEKDVHFFKKHMHNFDCLKFFMKFK